MAHCNNCKSEDISSSKIEERTRLLCGSCLGLTYSTRDVTGPYLMIADEIADGVAGKGTHKIATFALLNTVFRRNEKLDYLQQIDEWCLLHSFDWYTEEGTDSEGNRMEFTCFHVNKEALFTSHHAS